MTSVGALITTTRTRYLLGGLIEQRNQLAAPYTPGAAAMVFRYPLRGIGEGARLSIGLNTFYVWSVDATGQSAQVSGGEDGTVDVSADTGDIVQVSPRYTNSAIFDALNEELASLSSPLNGLYTAKTVSFVFNASTVGYDLPGVTDARQIIEVRYDENDPFRRTPRLQTSDYRLERDNSLSDFSSGYSLKLFRGGAQGRNVNVLYKSGFTSFTSIAQDPLDTGLAPSMLDIPPMGAAMRLLAGQEVRRNQTASQGDTRRADEVQAGAVAASSRGIAALRQTRIMEEAAKLQAAYPARIM